MHKKKKGGWLQLSRGVGSSAGLTRVSVCPIFFSPPQKQRLRQEPWEAESKPLSAAQCREDSGRGAESVCDVLKERDGANPGGLRCSALQGPSGAPLSLTFLASPAFIPEAQLLSLFWSQGWCKCGAEGSKAMLKCCLPF